jgi:hypothetical protein
MKNQLGLSLFSRMKGASAGKANVSKLSVFKAQTEE